MVDIDKTIFVVHIMDVILNIIILTLIYVQLKRAKWNIRDVLWAIPVIFWMVHAVIFNTFISINAYLPGPSLLPEETINIWSSALRLQAYIAVFINEFTRFMLSNIRGKK
jgi:hypothetical protein